MSDNLLDLELRLLLIRHGRRRVFQALSTVTETPVNQLEDDLRKAAAKKEERLSRKKKMKSPEEVTNELCKDRPGLRDMVLCILRQYENRAFLPELRHVRQFLIRAGREAKPKSRADAMPAVAKILIDLPEQELRSLAEPDTSGGRSDYAVLARQIMGKNDSD